jgi:CRP/FNR family cyclic AMP-dependent transcriptional regulator
MCVFGDANNIRWQFINMAIHVNLLRRFPLLNGLPEASLGLLAASVELRTLSRRGVAMQKNDVGQGLGFLLDGCLQGVDFTLDGREVGLYFVNPGDYFGELSVVDQQGLPELIIALVKSEILFMPEATARGLLFSSSMVAEQVMLRLATRVRSAVLQRTLLSLPNPTQRVCAQLLLMISPTSGMVEYAPTHQELAIMINTSRETVTRVFQSLQSQGVLMRDGSKILVSNLGLLKEIAEGRSEAVRI